MLPQDTPVQLPLAEQPLEEWRPVVGWEDTYEVSSLGRVRRSAPGNGTRPGRILRCHPNVRRQRYLYAHLWQDGQRTAVFVHALVAAAFLGPRPYDHDIDHIDNDFLNNTPGNLQYLSIKEHHRKTAADGRLPRGEQHHSRLRPETVRRGERVVNSILTTDQVLEMRRLSQTHTLEELGAMFGVHPATARDVIERRTWRHV